MRLKLLSMVAVFLGSVVAEAEPLRVVTTLPTFKALAEEVGGERVSVSSVAAPQFNPHFIEPKPSDVLRVKRADLFIHAGLDLEVWRQPLLDAAGNAAVRNGAERSLDLSLGISIRNVPLLPQTRAQGDIHLFGNPHYWSSPENGLIMARSIEAKLRALDPEGQPLYQERLRSFEGRLSKAMIEWRKTFDPFQNAAVVAYHDEWPYLVAFLGVKVVGFLEPKPGIPPSPKHLEDLMTLMKERNVRAIMQATYFPDSSSLVLAERTGARVVKLCQNVGERPECSGYAEMVDHNVRALAEALGG